MDIDLCTHPLWTRRNQYEAHTLLVSLFPTCCQGLNKYRGAKNWNTERGRGLKERNIHNITDGNTYHQTAQTWATIPTRRRQSEADQKRIFTQTRTTQHTHTHAHKKWVRVSICYLHNSLQNFGIQLVGLTAKLGGVQRWNESTRWHREFRVKLGYLNLDFSADWIWWVRKRERC